MKLLLAYLAALATFLVVDLAWITTVVTGAYEREIGPLISDEPRMAPAVAFYLGYVACLLFLAVRPAREAGSAGVAWLNGAVLGAFAYGTYALTNYAMIDVWSWHLVWTDMVWGVAISALVSWVGYLVARR